MKERMVKVKRYRLKRRNDQKVQANGSEFVGFFNVKITTTSNTNIQRAVAENSPKGFYDVLVEELECCYMSSFTPEEAKKRGWCSVCRYSKY